MIAELDLGLKRTPPQVAAIQNRKRYNVLDWGRRTGKTEIGKSLTTDITVRRGEPVGWFAPTYKMMADVWRSVAAAYAPIAININKSEHRIELRNGGVIEMWSLESEGAGRSRKYGRVIIDEAALVPDLKNKWESDIRPTLTDYRGDAWFLSTPKGQNYFWELYQDGKDPLKEWWYSSRIPTIANPIIDPAEVDEARQTLPYDIYRQEYEAEFLAHGAVFSNFREQATADWQIERKEGHRYVVGVDWGKYEDFTVFSVMDATLRELCYIERMNQINYPVQASRLMTVVERFQPTEVLAENNNVGDAIADFIYQWDIPLRQFTTTNESKQNIIEGLRVGFEQHKLSIIPDPVLTSELQAFGVERLPSGRLRYAAPSGYHDDCVMSLALAWDAAKSVVDDRPVEVSVPIITRIARIREEQRRGY